MIRLQHVQWRLIHSKHCLIQLTDEIGVKETSYLCKIFRKRFGMTPSQCHRNSVK
ncbi:AraC family transcriptional regulator [Vibrio sp. HI00D65]|uniref:AraC family transcriptional regulator n=1 Tax=Vibrio sp. HI00D65 TaxID=1822216 RepID=UPI0012F72716